MVKSLAKLIGRVIAYNWRYYALAVAVFLGFWQAYSVFNAVSVANDKLSTAMRQNAAYFEKAFLDGDVFETQRILWRVKNDNIKRITFHPISFEGSKWIFKEAVIGNLYDRPWAQRTYKIPFISNGAELGQLEYVVDVYDVNASVFEGNYVLFITVVVFFLGLLVLSNMGSIRAILAIERSVADINRLSDSGDREAIAGAVQKNIGALPPDLLGVPFAEMTGRMVDALQRTAKLENELAVSKAMSDLSAQVAHDIRSPLAALDMAVKNTARMPEEQRVVIRNASNRIRDIANNLIEKYRRPGEAEKHSGAVPSETGSVYLLSALLDPLLTEKRLQFQSRPGIQIDLKLPPESYGLFLKLQPVAFHRMVSNLVNNAVEALGETGSVSVWLADETGFAVLTIADNGKGIPPEILAKLGKKGETHGKAGGSGLGLYHARATAESWGGSLVISSEIGKGTTVTVRLPKAEPPDWFVPKLEFAAGKTVVVLDDDATIHQVWKGRFESSRVKERGIETFSFSVAEQLRDWVKSNPAKTEGAIYLLDYELAGHKETGLSIAEELNISQQSILVTSRWEEPQILYECKRLGIRLLPKGLSGIVPIGVIGAMSQNAVAALIDDDPLVHMTWKMAARQKGISLSVFKSPDEFLKANVAKEAVIYIDSELGNGVKGEGIAKKLFADGYKTIILATGHAPDSFPPMAWIKDIVGKEPPWQ